MADQYEITQLDQWEAVVEGDIDGDGASGTVLEIKGGQELREVPDLSREAMLAVVAHFAGTLLATVGVEVFAAAQLRERATFAAELIEYVLRGDAREYSRLIAALSTLPDEGDAEADLAAAEERSRLRMKGIFLQAIGESFSVAQLREEFGLSRQRLQQLRDARRLFAIDVPYEKGLLYPRWQFDSSGRPRPEMSPLIDAARDSNLDALGFHLLMTGSRDNGPSGLQMLRDGDADHAVALVRSADR